MGQKRDVKQLPRRKPSDIRRDIQNVVAGANWLSGFVHPRIKA
jgi:hypothetical protein